MINLLPKKQKEELAGEEMFKVVMILGIIAAAGLVCFALMLYIVRLFFFAQLDVKMVAVEDRKKMIEILKVGEEEAKNASYDSMFSRLDSFYKKQTGAVKIFEELGGAFPEGFYLTGFDLTERKVTLSGYCPDRDKLLIFKNNLEKQPGFKDVYFPTNNWIAQKDIKFNINFSYDPEG